ncbi:MAG: metal-binding protein [Thermaceae bacterium]
MPSGRAHEAINLTVLGLGGVIYLGSTPQDSWGNPAVLAFALSYLVGTFLITPDLDLAERQVRAKKRWGLLGVLWWPYGVLFRHRGLSHTWVIGPLTRLLYLGLVLYVLWVFLKSLFFYLVGEELMFRFDLPPGSKDLWLPALSGYYLSQWLHLVADGLWPKRRRSR